MITTIIGSKYSFSLKRFSTEAFLMTILESRPHIFLTFVGEGDEKEKNFEGEFLHNILNLQ
jgi:hypothetical protein